jgi:hypothetical protein
MRTTAPKPFIYKLSGAYINFGQLQEMACLPHSECVVPTRLVAKSFALKRRLHAGKFGG